MKKLYSIGEISKLFDLPIKTLRYYAEIDLLKPCFVNEDSNYRYYSIEQFIVIDIIKNCKLMGMSLSEIKEILDNGVTQTDMINLLDTQIELYDKQIKELTRVRSSMNFLRSNLEATPLSSDSPSIIHFEERTCLSFDYISKTVDEQEIHLREMILNLSANSRQVYAQYGISVSYLKYIKHGQLICNDMRVYNLNVDEMSRNNSVGDLTTGDNIGVKNEPPRSHIEIIPKGNYLTLNFDDNSYNKHLYYKIMQDYIRTHNLNVSGDFLETWILPRIDDEQQESTLVQLQILVV